MTPSIAIDLRGLDLPHPKLVVDFVLLEVAQFLLVHHLPVLFVDQIISAKL